MTTRLHVGNLPYTITDEELRELFSQAGTVVSVDIPKDRATGRSRGFGFADMENSEQAEEAIKKFDGYSLDGRALRVDYAREREQRASGYGSYGGSRHERGKQQGGRGRRMAA